MNQELQISYLRDFLTIIFKHKHKILIIFLTIVITVTIKANSLLTVYEAKSSFMVKFGREYIYQPEIGDTRPVPSFNAIHQEEAISSEIEILTSKDLIEKVIKALGIDNVYPEMFNKAPPKKSLTERIFNFLKLNKLSPDNDKTRKKISPIEIAVNRLKNNMSVKKLEKSNVIEVSFKHEDPVIAARVVNQIVESYKEKHLQVLSSPKSFFLEKQFAIYEKKLRDSEKSLEAFKQKHNVFSLDEQRSLLLNQRAEMDKSLKIVQNRIQELNQAMLSPTKDIELTTNLIPFYPQSERYNLIDNAKAELLTLQLKEQELLGKYKESSRLVVSVRKEIQLVKDFIKEQKESLIKAELKSLETKASNIKQQLSRLDKDIRTLDLTERELQVLNRNVATNEKNFKTYLTKLEEARIAEDMDRQNIANIGIIQEAFVPSNPLPSRKNLFIALGVIIGILAGVGFSFFSEYLSLGLNTPESAERFLDLPVLTSISYSKSNSPLLTWGFGTAILALFITGVFWVSQDNSTVISQLENLVASRDVNDTSLVSESRKEIVSSDNDLLNLSKETRAETTVKKEIEPEITMETDQVAGKLPVLSISERTVHQIHEPSDLNFKKDDIRGENESMASHVHKPELTRRIKIPLWTINASSTLLKDNATSLKETLKKAGHNVYLTEFKHNNALWYRVRVGFFTNREDAQKIGQILSEKYAINNFWIDQARISEIKEHKTSHWVINIYSTQSKDAAVQLLKKIKREGHDAFVTEVRHDGALWYRVSVGHFFTRRDAQIIGQDISEKYFLDDYWIAKAPAN